MEKQLPRRDQSRFTIFLMVLALDLFVIGGFVALLIVNRLLNIQLDIYAQNINAASVLIDFMDDLLPYHIFYYGVMSILAVLTVVAWAWSRPQSRVLRYAAVALLFILVAISAWLFLGRSETITSVPPMITPTPVALSGG
ncbi:MAG: hypothetical protein ACK2UQ_03720 [Anaerolineae bacterium]